MLLADYITLLSFKIMLFCCSDVGYFLVAIIIIIIIILSSQQ